MTGSARHTPRWILLSAAMFLSSAGSEARGETAASDPSAPIRELVKKHRYVEALAQIRPFVASRPEYPAILASVDSGLASADAKKLDEAAESLRASREAILKRPLRDDWDNVFLADLGWIDGPWPEKARTALHASPGYKRPASPANKAEALQTAAEADKLVKAGQYLLASESFEAAASWYERTFRGPDVEAGTKDGVVFYSYADGRADPGMGVDAALLRIHAGRALAVHRTTLWRAVWGLEGVAGNMGSLAAQDRNGEVKKRLGEACTELQAPVATEIDTGDIGGRVGWAFALLGGTSDHPGVSHTRQAVDAAASAMRYYRALDAICRQSGIPLAPRRDFTVATATLAVNAIPIGKNAGDKVRELANDDRYEDMHAALDLADQSLSMLHLVAPGDWNAFLQHANVAFQAQILEYDRIVPNATELAAVSAEPWLDLAVAAGPKVAEVYYQRAAILSHAPRREKVLADLQKFLELAPGDPRASAVRKLLESAPKDK
jgi:tetratricopeptide (TPR) repeat protein